MVGRNASLALVGDLAAKLGLLAVVVVAARALSTVEYARLGVALAAAGILATVLDAGVSVLLVRDGARDAARRGELFRAALRGRVPFLAGVAAAGIVLGAVTGQLALVVASIALAAANAATLSVLALFRAAQDLRYEAVAKLASGLLWPLAAVAAALVYRSASAVVIALAAVVVLGVAVLLPCSRRVVLRRGAVPAIGTLRAALPLGLLAAATLVYFRSGTIMLGAWSSPEQTAAFTIASSVGFGLLLIPNAITTGLLPRLAAESNDAARGEVTRRAVAWTAAICLAVAGITVALAPALLPLLVGARYTDAVRPLTILAAASVLIGVSGTLGTWLVAERRMRILGLQVALSLAVNLGIGALLVRRFGADGAAWATVATEATALLVLAAAVVRRWPAGLAEAA
jgi:O-antigen/teichoic acid export membrane protein